MFHDGRGGDAVSFVHLLHAWGVEVSHDGHDAYVHAIRSRTEYDLYKKIFLLSLADLSRLLEYRWEEMPVTMRSNVVTAIAWLLSTDEEWPSSFANICVFFSVSSDQMRRSVIRHLRTTPELLTDILRSEGWILGDCKIM